VIIVMQTDGEKQAPKPLFEYLKNSLFGLLVPRGVFELVVCLIGIYTTRSIEQFIGSRRVLFLGIGMTVLELVVHGFMWIIGYPLYTKGPIGFVCSLSMLYCILFPTLRSWLFGMSEKKALFFNILLTIPFSGGCTIPSIICGLFMGLLVSPFITTPIVSEEKVD